MATDHLQVPTAENGASVASSSTLPPPTLSLLPSNVVSIFLARFHVRNGNQIDYQWPPPPPPPSTAAQAKDKLVDVDDPPTAQDGGAAVEGVDLTGVEWKVLPSGGHLIDSDVIYFQPSQSGRSNADADDAGSREERRGQVGVACFRNVKLDATSSSSPNGADGTSTVAAAPQLDQRGARMISVGLVLACLTSESETTPTAHQLAIVPHLENLEKLADQLVADPEQTDLLKAYYEAHSVTRQGLVKNGAEAGQAVTPLSASRSRQLRLRRRRDPKNLYHDPTSHLPAMCSALGPLLPAVLKKLMVPGHRMLIFAPAPPLRSAANIGYNLADLVSEAAPRSRRGSGGLVPVRVRGQIGVHDIPALEAEEKQRKMGSRDAAESVRESSWISWSSDKILLEKPQLFDTVLDLSALVSQAAGGRLDEGSLLSSTACAKLLRTVRKPVYDTSSAKSTAGPPPPPPREKAEAKKQSWTTREFATFNELDAQAERHADRLVLLGGRSSRTAPKRKASKSSLSRNSEHGARHHGGSGSTRRGQRHADEAQGMTRSESALSQWRGGCARSPRRTPGGLLSAILAFLRYWLAGWWFLPSHWRYDLPSSYVLPLGIRGDGGVRSSIMIMPISDDDDDDIDAASDEEEEASSDGSVVDDGAVGAQESRSVSGASKLQAASHGDAAGTQDAGVAATQGTDPGSINSGDANEGASTVVTHSTESTISAGRDDDDEEEEDDDIDLMGPPDPLLAAVGANVPRPHGHLHHHSDGRKSPASGRRSSGVSSGADDDDMTAASSTGGRRRTVGSVSSGGRALSRRMSFDRYGNHIPLSSSSIRGGMSDDLVLTDDDDDNNEEGDGSAWSLVLSDSLWTVWSRWTRALVDGLVEILQQEREAAILSSSSSSSEGGEGETERRRLLDAAPQRALRLKIGTRQMASLGLSAANDGDVELVRSLAPRVLARLDRADADAATATAAPARWEVEVEKVWLKWFL